MKLNTFDIFPKTQSNMISNTSCSELKLVEQAGLVLDENQQNFQLKTSTPSYVNNNNNEISSNKDTTLTQISTDQRQITNPFAFYSKSGIGNSIQTNECAAIVLQNSSDDYVKNSSSHPSSKCFDYTPCTYFNSTQEIKLTKKIFKKFRNESALNDFSRMSGCGIISLIHGTDKSISDTRNNLLNTKTSSCSSKICKSVRQETPMCRTEDQEYAFRQIEDVHNYSKLNRYGYCNNENSRGANIPTYSSNSSNPDEDDDEEEEDEDKEDEEFDIVHYEQLSECRNPSATAQHNGNAIKIDVPVTTTQQQKKKQSLSSSDLLKTEHKGNTTPPDHHARRPMNAFLIFCKRHRGIVKDKYKNYENRSITKILGEWWASLDANDKKCYVNLAKQNKDAFFSANPNFKWYKLPAPSLRTLNTRPGNIERGEYQCELGDLMVQNNIVSTSCDMPSSTETKKVSYFKLADENQMGGLSNLMSPNTISPSKNEDLQTALSETSSFFNSSCNRKSNIAEEDSLNHKLSHSDKNCSSSEDESTPKKSARSCKGKKYQELINSGQISAVTPKKQMSPKPSNNLNNSERSQYFIMHIDKCSKVKTSPKNQILVPKKDAQSKTDNGQWVMTHYQDSYGFNKQQFGFVSFDLEEKIKRLPAQCLETYLQRKKNTKRKKKINSKKRSSPQQSKFQEGFSKQTTQPKTALEAKEQIIGSQKRKARKESITRRDITSKQNDIQFLLGNSHVTSAFVVGRRSPTNQLLSAVNQNATSDLLILAEVAANCTDQ